MSSGGSYDVASHIAKEVLNYNPPEAFGGYEWFTIGGRKMSSSKGVGSSAKEVSEILPPQVLRFLFVRTQSPPTLILIPVKKLYLIFLMSMIAVFPLILTNKKENFLKENKKK